MIKRLIQLILDQSSARKLEREVNRSMKRTAKDTESTFSKAFKRMAAAFVGVFAVRKLVSFTREMFRLGASAAETASKFETVFGAERAAQLDGFLDKFARMAGLTRTAGREMLANFGAVFQGAGLAADASARLSQQMVELAGDLQSFHDVPIAEAFAAIRSGATGEAEPLKRFGIVLRAVDVDARALATTGKKLAKELTEQERVVARLALIQEKAGKAVGDLERTQNSTANRARQLNARYQEIRETIAIGLLPALEQLLPVFEQLAEKAETFAVKVSGATQALLEMAGLVNQTLAIEVAGITRQLEGMDEAQRQAFLTSRLQRAAADYAAISEEIRELEIRSRALEAVGAPGHAARIKELRLELEATGEVMNTISRLMSAPSAAPGIPEVTGTEDGGVGDLASRITAVNEALLRTGQEIPTTVALFDSLTMSTANYAEKMEAGRLVTEAVRTPMEVLDATLAQLDVLLATGAISWDTYTRAVQAANAALAEQNSEANKLIGQAGKLLGGLGAIGGLLGFGLGPAGGIFSAVSSFAGFFHEGGHIPAGKTGIVGEKGPELVHGPANVTPMGKGAIVINIGPSKDPASWARDQQWVRAWRETELQVRVQGGD